MSTDDVAAPSVTLNKRPLSHKHRIHSHSPSARKTRTDEFRLNRTMTAINRPPSKLPALPAKVSIYSSASGCRSQPSKIEQQSTTIDSETPLPVLYSLFSDQDQERMSEFRRRQIYALNHFMRDLEQEQFRQLCKIHENNTVDKNEDTNKDLLT